MSGETTKVYDIDFKAVANDIGKRLVEMEHVLEWASENVMWDSMNLKQGWKVGVGHGNPFTGPTLYQALHTAWEKRDE